MRIVALALLAFVAASPAVKSPVKKQDIKKPVSTKLILLYTSSARGQIRSCNCTKFRFGGYGRQLTLIKSIKNEHKNVLLLEGGDCTSGVDFQSELKAQVAAKALKLCSYSAMIPGEEELGIRGVNYLKQFSPKDVPIICGNLVNSESEKPAFPAYKIIIYPNGTKTAIIGLISKSLEGPFLEKAGDLRITDPINALKKAMKDIGNNADLAIVVYHGPVSETEKLARQKGVDLIISTHITDEDLLFTSGENNIVEAPVKKTEGVYIIDSGTRSNWSLGRLDIEIHKGNSIKNVTHKLIYLDRRYDEDPEMVSIYDDYNQKVKDAVLNRTVAFRKDAEALLVKRGLDVESMRKKLRKSDYVTAEKCRDCHSEIYDSWSRTSHSRAIKTLEKVNQEYDPECFSCHATGVMARNAYINQKETPELANVQCEACHGPGRTHSESPDSGYGSTGEMTCRSCHTEDRNPDFDYKKMWDLIKH